MSGEIWWIRVAAVLLMALVAFAMLGWARSQRRLLAAYQELAKAHSRGAAMVRLLGGVVDCPGACHHCVKQIHDGLGELAKKEGLI